MEWLYISPEVNGTDDVLWNGSEECEEDESTDYKDGDSDSDW
jgi:hypothetical protein